MRGHRALGAELPGVAHRAAQQPAQHVAAALVRRHHAVADEEGDGTAVIGEDAQADVGRWRRAVANAGGGFAGGEHGLHEVDGEDVVDPLGEHRHPVQPRSGVDRLGGQVTDDVIRDVLDVLHEHEVPELHEPLLVAPPGRHRPRTPDPGRRRAPSTDRPGRPPPSARSCPCHGAAPGSAGTPTWSIQICGRLVVAVVHREPQPLGIEAEDLGEELVGPGDRLLLEVVAEGEVAQHLEERQVACVVPTMSMSTVRMHFCDVVARGIGGRLVTEEVGLERDHPGDGEQQGRVDRDQRGRGHDGVAALREESR